MSANTLRFWKRWTQSLRQGLLRRRPLRLSALEDRLAPATLYGLTETGNQLYIFDSASPGTVTTLNVTGLSGGENLLGIDFRPADLKLYGFSDKSSKVYSINTATGAATLVGTPGIGTLSVHFGFDFNPTVDRIRVVGDAGNNLRLNPNDGSLTAIDTPLNGATSSLAGAAYTNNFAGAQSTKLYGIDANSDSLVLVTNPNGGTTSLVGALGVDTDGRVGFDIAFDDGVAYASLTVGGVSKLYTIDLTTGAATLLGKIGNGAVALSGLTAKYTTNVPPVVTVSGAAAKYDIQTDTPVLLDAGVTVTDIDSPNFNGGSLLVTLSGGVAGDVIDIQNQGTGPGQVSTSAGKVFVGGVEVGFYLAGSDVLPLVVTFNANATPAAAQAVARAVTFATTDNSLVPPNRTATFDVSDGGATGSSKAQTVLLGDFTPPSVVSIVRNDADPTNATLVSFTVNFSEDVSGVSLSAFSLNLTGTAAGTLNTLTVVDGKTYTVTVNAVAGDGQLRLDLVDDDSIVDGAGNPLGGPGAGNGDFTLGQAYKIDNTDPVGIITLDVGQTDPANTQPVVFLVNWSEPVTGFDQSDIVVGGTAPGAPVVVVTAIDASNYTVSISGFTGDGTVVITFPANSAFDAAGNGSEASVNFSNSVTLVIENQGPVITAPPTATGTEDTPLVFAGADLISISDADAGANPIEVKLTATNGTLTLSGVTGLTFSVGTGTDDATMTFQGTLADINAALDGLTFNPDANFNGPATVTVFADDLGNTGLGGPLTATAVIGVTINAVNDGPTITITGPFTTPEDTPLNFPAGSIVIADPDAGANPIEVSLTVGNGTLTLGVITGLTFSVGTGTDDATMTFQGTIADINAALDTLVFTPAANFVGAASVLISVDDLGNSGSGGANLVTDTFEIDVTAVNDGPTITAPASVSFDEDTTFNFDGANTISIADDDAGTNPVEVKISTTTGTLTLGVIDGLTFSVGTGTADATMTFQGTIADINAALATLSLTPALNFNGPATVSITVDDLGNGGAGGPQTVTQDIAVTVNPVNDGPTITITGPFATDEDVPFSFPAGSVVIADLDAAGNPVEVTLSVTNGTLTLGTTTNLTFSVGDGTNDATMTFQGTIADINAALDTLIFTPALNFNGDATLTVEVDDLGANGSGGSQTATESATITVNAVNDGPTINAPGSVTFDEDMEFFFNGANTISITDVDAGTGSIKVSLATTTGTLTMTELTGITFSVGDGTGDASMTFTGTLTNVNAAIATLRVTPATNFNGTASLTINVDDQGNSGSGGSKTADATVTLNVTAVNDPPTVVNSTFKTLQNIPITISAPGVLAGANDPEGSTLTATLVTGVPAAAGTLTLQPNGGFSFVPATNFVGTVTFQFQASDGSLTSNVGTVTIEVGEFFTRLFATGAGAGGQPHVNVYNLDGTLRFAFDAFDPAFRGGVTVATGDVNGDGVEDIIVGAGAGGGPHVRVVSGKDLQQIHSFYAFDPNFTGGVNVAAGDVNNDGVADVIVGAGAGGGPHVRVFDGKTGQVIQEFFAYDAAFKGGVNVAGGDLDGDGRADIVTGAGPGGGPHVIVYKGGHGQQILRSFYAFDEAFTGGVQVAVGAFNNEPTIFTAAGAGGVPVVSAFNFDTGAVTASFFAFAADNTGGVRIATEVQSNGRTTLYLAAGRNFAPSVRVLDADTLNDEQNFNAYDPAWLGGVFIG